MRSFLSILVKMKNLFQLATFCSLWFNWIALPQAHANTSAEIPGVYELKQQGWKVIDKQSRVESRPGLKSYQNLKREVLVINYRLLKNTQNLYCVVEYDSQLDTIRESCEPNREKALQHVGE